MAVKRVKRIVAHADGLWFDLCHGIKTHGHVSIAGLTLASGPEFGADYLAARHRSAKRVLRAVPVADHSQFTFIDLGSGKGLVLFLAADYPYRSIRGVEFARELHTQAVRNIATFRSRTQRCRDIESVYGDVRNFQFPTDNLVIYLFNPFPPATLESTLANLRQSLEAHPRELFLVALYPDDLAPVLQSQPWLGLQHATPRYHVYRALSQ